VLSLGFLLLISMLLTAALSATGKYIAPYLPEATLQVAGFLASFTVIAVLFAMMFKWLPDTPIGWRDVWLGAILTAALFEVGKKRKQAAERQRGDEKPPDTQRVRAA
jgi:membrane protein